MKEILLDSLLDTVKLLPFLFIAYILIEVFEQEFADKIKHQIKRAGWLWPFFGAIFWLIPQCGFSVISSTLYNRKLITLWTLLAVYLATSDEAIPIILSHPDKINVLRPLLVTKFIIAIIAWFIIDLVLRKSQKKILTHHHHEDPKDECNIMLEKVDPIWCCGHHCNEKKFSFKEFILHPVFHTLKIASYIFIITLILNRLISYIWTENLSQILLQNTIRQPVITAFIGLIPNCAASVIITEMFLQWWISFGAAISWLSAGAWLWLLVLLRWNHRKISLKIIWLLLAISIFSWIIIQILF